MNRFWRCVLGAFLGAAAPGCGAPSDGGPSDVSSEIVECPWFIACSVNGACGSCQDEDLCTSDQCIDGHCLHIPLANTCDCTPSCGPDGRLSLLHTLSQGDGGVPEPDGALQAVASADEQHVYVTARTHGNVVHVVRHQGGYRVAEAIPIGTEAEGVAMTDDESTLFVATQDGLRGLARDTETGRLTVADVLTDPAVGVATAGEWVATVDTVSLHLYRWGPQGLDPVDVSSDLDLAGARRLIFAPNTTHVYVAGYESGVVTAWRVSDDGLEKVDAVQGQRGLDHPTGLAFTPSGDILFVTGFCDHDIAVLSHDSGTGGLTWLRSLFADRPDLGCVVTQGDMQIGPSSSTRTYNPTDIAVSHGGEQFVVVSPSGGLTAQTFLLKDGVVTYLHEVKEKPPYTAQKKISIEPFEVITEPSKIQYPPFHHFSASVTAATTGFVATSYWGNLLAIIPSDESPVDFVQRGDHGVQHLSGAYNLAPSPDGDNLYIAGRASQTLASFATDLETGGLIRQSSPDLSEVLDLHEVTGNVSFSNVVVSQPDGKNVYAVGGSFQRLVVFDRDDESGALSFGEMHNLASCDGQPPFPVGVEITPDGQFVLVADFQYEGRSCLLSYPRGPDGRLSDAVSVNDPSLDGLEDVVVTQSGKHVYGAAYVAEGVAHLSRDPETGAMTVEQPLTLPSLRGLEFVALSPAEEWLYATSPVTSTVHVVGLSEDGAMSHHQVIGYGKEQSAPAGIAVAPDGEHIYVAQRKADVIMLYRRQSDGTLVLADTTTGLDTLDWVNGIVLNADGTLLYAAAVDAGAVTVFRVLDGPDDGCGKACR